MSCHLSMELWLIVSLKCLKMILKEKVFLIVYCHSKKIHFAVEGFSLFDNETCKQIENIWQVKKTISNCDYLK